MKVFFDERMVGPMQNVSPSPQKPKLLAERCKSLNLPLEFCDVTPIEWDDFLLSHSKEYVEGVRRLEVPNGFGTICPIIRDTLPYTTGSLLCAARAALKEGIAWSFTSGFHHATYHRGMGFCTFEGISITLKKLILECAINKAFVLDGDAHDPNGVRDAIQSDVWNHRIFVWHTGRHQVLASSLYENILPTKPDLIIFQDGMDSYHYDPLSEGPGLSYTELYMRARTVCKFAHDHKIPLVINLAGGYKRWQGTIEPVLVGHSNSIIASIEIFENENLNRLPNFGPYEWEQAAVPALDD